MKKFNSELIKTISVGQVTEDDLKGSIRYLTIPLVQRMCEEQVRQGNPFDVTIFQNNRASAKWNKGFNWNKSKEGQDYWKSKLGL